MTAPLLIANARAVDGAPLSLLLAGGRIQALNPSPTLAVPIWDAAGLTLAPGFIDLQLNGGFNHDFTVDPAAIWPVAARLPRFGVTAFLPTIITAPPAAAAAAQAVLAAGPPAGWQGAQPLGLHLEGPFLNPARKGAHNPAHLRLPPAPASLDWAPATGVRLVTLAPELPGALALSRALADRGIVVSAGHSAASAAAARAGFAAGISYVTHLFNAMSPLHHREPGLVGAALDEGGITLGLIVDGVHVDAALVRLVWRVAADRVNVVSDAMAGLGLPDGACWLGDHEVTVRDGSARLADGTLAGSCRPLDGALRRLRAATAADLPAALAPLTTVPADLLGIGDRKGRIAAGFDADFVLLTAAGTVAATFVAGELVFGRELLARSNN